MTKEKTGLHYLIILSVCFFAFFINNTIQPADLMEARNLATAQEIVKHGNYLVPTMNGELRLEKPPLPTWIAAGIEHVLPDNLAAQRAAAGVAATCMVLFLFLLVRHFTKNSLIALFASVILATSFNVIMMGRTASWDIYCHSFMLGAIYFFVLAVERDGKQWMFFSLAGLFMGLSFLSKGPISFYALLLPFLVSYFAITRTSVRGKIAPLLLMIGICLVCSFWWPIYIAISHADFGMKIANKESSSWLNHNVRPIWYYWQFPAEAGIWCLFWVTSLIYFFWKKKTDYRKFYQVSIVWTIIALVLLSIIPEKKTRYLLPLLIPGAINIACYFYYSARTLLDNKEKLVFRINGCIIAVVALILPFAVYYILKDSTLPYALFIIIIVACIAILVVLLKSLFYKQGIRVLPFFAASVLLMITFESFCLPAVKEIFINDKRHSVHLLRDNTRVQDLPFYYPEKEGLRMEIVYEANTIIRPMDIDNDTLFQMKTPFVFISTQPIKDIFSNKAVSIEMIDIYDNNWRKVTDKRYNKDLVKEVAIIYPNN